MGREAIGKRPEAMGREAIGMRQEARGDGACGDAEVTSDGLKVTGRK